MLLHQYIKLLQTYPQDRVLTYGLGGYHPYGRGHGHTVLTFGVQRDVLISEMINTAKYAIDRLYGSEDGERQQLIQLNTEIIIVADLENFDGNDVHFESRLFEKLNPNLFETDGYFEHKNDMLIQTMCDNNVVNDVDLTEV